MTGSDVVLQVEDLRTEFRSRGRSGLAVDGVTFDLRRGEVLGIIGESGSGKSLTALSIMGMHPQPGSRILSGSVRLEGQQLVGASPRALEAVRGRRIAYVPQDPQTSLNPVLPIWRQFYDPMRRHRVSSGRADARRRAAHLLQLVRVPDPAKLLDSFPHQYSGGMRQRVVSAIALSCQPSVLIADEPTTSLDVTVQAAYLSMLRSVQRERDLSVIFISHDLGTVATVCDRVAVMYAGNIVELATTAEILTDPRHPYTQALIASLPDPMNPPVRLPVITGTPPDIFDRPPGCPFAPRCPGAADACAEEQAAQHLAGGRYARCWRAA